MVQKRFYCFLFVIFFMTGCSKDKQIKDLEILKQNPLEYCSFDDAGNSVNRAFLKEHFNNHFFSPWKTQQSTFSKDEFVNLTNRFYSGTYYGENKQKRNKEWFVKLIENTDVDLYNKDGVYGITVKSTSIRLLPTDKPCFLDFNKPGEGYPFDYLQNSFLPINTPILITHISKDKAWVFIETPFLSQGWIPIDAVVTVDKYFITEWKKGPFISFIKDDVPLYDKGNKYLFSSYIGMMFPKLNETEKSYVVKVAVLGEKGKLRSEEVIISKKHAVEIPLTLTQSAVAQIANEFIGKSYGWGGLYGDRDCSAMLKSLFVPFGIWLPRNSFDQAYKAGYFITFEGITPEAKRELIVKKGIPFKTLLYLKGHIMLYIGEHNGEILVLHSLWGLRTKNLFGKAGRKVIGKAVITSLYPGIELFEVKKSNTLFYNLQGMTLLDYSPVLEDVRNLNRDKSGVCVLINGKQRKLYVVKENMTIFEAEIVKGQRGLHKQNPHLSNRMVDEETYSIFDTELYFGKIEDLRVKVLANGKRVISKDPKDSILTEQETRGALDEKLWDRSYAVEDVYIMVLDYPNEIDRTGGKTGSNVMLHTSLNFENLGKNYKGTFGCVTISCEDARILYQYVNPDTPVRIVDR